MSTKTTQQQLIEAITKRREELGMTITALYTAADISKPAFFRKMKGMVAFTTTDIDRIAAALDCTVQVLLTVNSRPTHTAHITRHKTPGS